MYCQSYAIRQMNHSHRESQSDIWKEGKQLHCKEHNDKGMEGGGKTRGKTDRSKDGSVEGDGAGDTEGGREGGREGGEGGREGGSGWVN